MGIFTRFRDIVNANINSILDSAEDPEKLLKLMIREMEDTLVELKASCANSMATKARVQREFSNTEDKANEWAAKAELAVSKGRDDLAREALLEKRGFREKADALSVEVAQHEEIVDQYKKDIVELEDKLEQARKQHRVLVQRAVRAEKKKKAQTDIRRANHQETIRKFEQFESRIDQIEAEADLVNLKAPGNLSDEFRKLEQDDELEAELAALKDKQKS